MLRTALTLIAATIPSLAAAQTYKMTPVSEQTSRYDIAGVRLGMSPTQAIDQAKQRGYFIERPEQTIQRSCNIACVVDGAVSARKGLQSTNRSTDIKFIHLWGPRNQVLEILFAPSMTGQVATEVRYAIRSDQITEQKFYEEVDRKYAKKFSVYNYCFEQEPICNKVQFQDTYYMPHLTTKTARMSIQPLGHHFYLLLEEGTMLRNARAKAIATTVERMAPRDAKPAF